MSATGVYTYINPPAGTLIVAPSSYWVIPNNATSVSCQASTFNSGGSPVTVSNLTAVLRDVTDSTNTLVFNGGTANSTGVSGGGGSTNGSRVFTAAATIGSSCGQLRLQVTSYTGRIYTKISARRSGSWSAIPVYVRRSGAWHQIAVYVRRSGAWSQLA